MPIREHNKTKSIDYIISKLNITIKKYWYRFFFYLCVVDDDKSKLIRIEFIINVQFEFVEYITKQTVLNQ